MRGRLSQIEADIPNQLSFPHTQTILFIVEFMLFGRWRTFFLHIFQLLPRARLHVTECMIALLHIESTTLVFSPPFPHINLCWVPF